MTDFENIAPLSPELTAAAVNGNGNVNGSRFAVAELPAVRLPVALSPGRSVGGKKTPHSKEVRETVHALYVAGVPPLRISRKTGVSHNTVRKWAQRHKWTLGRDALDRHTDGAVVSTVAEKIAQRSEEVRDKLSQGLVSQADILAEHPPKSFEDIAGGKGKRGHAETSLTLINASEKLFGWNQQSGPGCLVQINYLADLRPRPPQEQPACVDVQASVVSAPEQTKP
jgi:transposase-like protein